MENDPKPMSTKELTAAVSLLLKREETRAAQERRQARRRVRRKVRDRRQETKESLEKLTHSIEVIKWCIISITAVMAISLLVLVTVVWQIGNEAQRINGEVEEIKGEAKVIVQQIQDQAEKIRDKIQNPLRSIGGALGGQLDEKIGGALGLESE